LDQSLKDPRSRGRGLGNQGTRIVFRDIVMYEGIGAKVMVQYNVGPIFNGGKTYK
jgi:hypothetical protein